MVSRDDVLLKKIKADVKDQKNILSKSKKDVRALLKERKRLQKVLLQHGDMYLDESRKALSTAILAAFAFLMALSWREYISDLLDSVLIYTPLESSLISALIITLISVVGIILVNRFLKVK
ncbi:MAG: hypothetical protein ACI83O_000117 [Patescibacteria group bacterium]|jgi:hypothetical protein